MPALTTTQKDRLRRTNQRTKLYVSYLKPLTLWTARVNQLDIVTGQREFDFDAGAGTVFDWVEPYQTVYAGTFPGGRDLGIARIRAISSGDAGVTGTLTIAANSVYWEDDAYLTFLHDYRLWSIFPRIDPSEIFYKDFDIPYTDQNKFIRGIPVMGPSQAQFSVPGVGFVYNIPVHLSYTIDPSATLTNYAVSITPLVAGMIIGIFSPTTGVDITIPDGPSYFGQYWVKLELEDSNGKTEVSYRCLFHHDPTPGAENYPNTDFRTIVFTGDWNNGGWEAEVTMEERAALADIPDGTLAVIWAEQYFNDVLFDMTLLTGSTNLLMSGYVIKDQFTKDPEPGSEATFTIATVDAILKNRSLFSVSLESRDDPETWWQYLNGYLTAGHITHHFYSEHSTLFQITDVLGLDDDGDIQRKAVDIERGTLYTMIDDLVRNRGIFAHICCDKWGRVHLSRDLVYRDDSVRAAAIIVADIEDKFIIPPIMFVRASEPSTAFVFLSGVSYDGTDATPIGSTAPYEWPSPLGGDIEDIERQMIADQAECNRLAGQVFAVRNNIFPEIRVHFAGNFLGVLEVALMEWWTMTVVSADTIREIELEDIKMICRQVTATFDSAAGTLDAEAIFEPEVVGEPGIVYEWPPDSPDPGGLPPVVTTPTPGTGFGTVYVLEPGVLGRTRLFSAASPTWSAIDPADSEIFWDFILHPWNPYAKGFLVGESGMWKSTDLTLPSPSWSQPFTAAGAMAVIGATDFFNHRHVLSSINFDGFVASFFTATVGGTDYVYCARSTDDGLTWTFVQIAAPGPTGGGGWFGAADYVPHQVGGQVRMYVGLSVGTNRLTPLCYRSDDGGLTWAQVGIIFNAGSGAFYNIRSVHVPYNDNPTGDIVYMAIDGSNAGVWGSTDAGVTWSQIHIGGGALDNYMHRINTETYTENRLRGFHWQGSNNNLLHVTDDAFVTTNQATGTGLSGTARASGGFPYNDNQFYVVADTGIYVSINRGENWIDKTGDWAFGLTTPRAIVPLWLAE